jgi:hypothetical protein
MKERCSLSPVRLKASRRAMRRFSRRRRSMSLEKQCNNPVTIMSEVLWLGLLKCLATGKPESLLTDQRSSAKRSPKRLPVFPIYILGQRRHTTVLIIFWEIKVKLLLIIKVSREEVSLSVCNTWAHVKHTRLVRLYVPSGKSHLLEMRLRTSRSFKFLSRRNANRGRSEERCHRCQDRSARCGSSS